ncbi:hypothetical protein MH928_07365 [Flavobacterium sp. WW92]|nr:MULTISPECIES: hypothetical protein [unclassified Flavobacterium]WDO14508.1 hypothetical protein MH928_07365 [Flavobacterium sp. WW92]
MPTDIKMEQLNKYILLLGLLLFNNVNAQENKNFFITRDTIVLDSPVIISFKNTDGMFLINENYIRNKKNLDIQKMIDEGRAYVYSDEFYRFLSLKELEMKPIYNDCPFISNEEYSENIIIRKLNASVNSFLLCFVRLDFYNEKNLSPNHKKTNFSKKRNLDFYKIVFPICK